MRRSLTVIITVILAIASAVVTRLVAPSALAAGGADGAAYQLPNGWRLTPAGKHIGLGTMPLNLALSPDEHYILALNNGYAEHSVTVIDTRTLGIVQSVPLNRAFVGIAFAPNGERFYVATGSFNAVQIYRFANGQAAIDGEVLLEKPSASTFAAGLAVHPNGETLYVVDNLGNKLNVVNLARKSVVASVGVGGYPYTCAVSPDGAKVYVSNWGSATVSVVDTKTNQVVDTIAVGHHPNDLAFAADGKRLFVASGNDNIVDAIDTTTGKVIEHIWLALYPKAPAGTTSNGLNVHGDRLYVTNADNNDLAVVDISNPRQSNVLGFIPTGWYPTAVRSSKDGKQLYVLDGKGLKSTANPGGPQAGKRSVKDQYIGRILTGALSVIDTPNENQLAAYTRQVKGNAPYSSDELLKGVTSSAVTAIPTQIGAPSPIKHVVYIIKENRTYDQVYGDMKEGNGDANLCLFNEKLSPNHHALAREFVLFDNLYANAEVSASGHNWSMAAYATDYVEKTWPTQYSRRGRPYDYEGPVISWPTGGYIWDYCQRAGVSYRSYGEFTANGRDSDDPTTTEVTALKGHIDPSFRGFDLKYPDQKRADEWLREFHQFEKDGQMPQLEIVRLPNDHTGGAAADSKTPAALVADNDLALGRIVEAVSHSDHWKDTAIFVIEDDAQDGPDHVDAHRTVGLVISAYTKRHFVDHTMYSTASMLRTMELILGLPPMSQYDAGATPMFNSFMAEANMSGYEVKPETVNLKEMNPPRIAELVGSPKFDLSTEDAAPDREFNEVIWKVMRGPDSQMPAPVRSAFQIMPESEHNVMTMSLMQVFAQWRGSALLQ